MYRLVALDVDGTLLDSQHKLLPSVQDAVAQAQSRGVIVCLATGKLLASVSGLVAQLSLSGPQVTCNGAAIVDATSHQIRDSWPLEPSALQAAMIATADLAADLQVAWYCADAIYTMAPHGPLDEILAAYHEPPLRHVETFDGSIPPPLKLLMTGNPDRLATVKIGLAERLDGIVNVMRTTADFVEITSPNVSKGVALAALARDLGVKRSEIIAIGDGENDLTMFQVSGVSVAMGNAMPLLKQYATAVTASADAGGVAHALAALGIANARGPIEFRWL